VHGGKRALRRPHRRKIDCGDESRWTGSVALDEALAAQPEHAQEHRWDYGLGFARSQRRERALWVEVHPAETSEVAVVLRKLQWLKTYLQASCPALWRLTLEGGEAERFFWVASGRTNIPSTSPQYRRLRAAGLAPPRSHLHVG
jgi:hypothetical protein